MLSRPAKVVHKRIPKHPLFPRYTPLAHHPLRRRLQGQRQHRHLPVCPVLRLVRRDGRAQRQLPFNAAQAGEEDRAQGEVGLDVGAGDADLETSGGGRTGRRGDEADGGSAGVVAPGDGVGRPEGSTASEALVTVDSGNELVSVSEGRVMV